MRLFFLVGFFVLVIILTKGPREKLKTEEKQKNATSNSNSPTKIKQKQKPSRECMDTSNQFLKVVKKIDNIHYLLRNTANYSDSSHIKFETRKTLSIGEIIQIEKVTLLGVRGNYPSYILLWREGCTTKEQNAVKITKGARWPAKRNLESLWIIKNGKSCYPAVGILSPQYIMKRNPNCIKTDQYPQKGFVTLDCRYTQLRTHLVYAKSKKKCQKMVEYVKSRGL